jgi:cellulose synthase/poly-beta-1,6-N-acetylglucosamine synthase-like glycosyltransferase
MWPTLVFGVTAFVFLGMTFVVLRHLRWVQRLPALNVFPPAASAPEKPIRCSVVIAARDEQARIEQTLLRLLAQRGVQLECIVVDDRSTDRTSEILRRLAKEDARIQMKRVDELPEGWLGKCHACHLGASAATGDWILFADADGWLKPDVIARAVRLAEHHGVDHVTLSSGVSRKTAGLRASHLLFLMGCASWFSGANRDRPNRGLGFGSFNLVRASAYRQCGGYEALRLTVLDDMRLGLLLRRAGKRTRGFMGGNEVECHWGTSAWSMVRIMEKNYFAAFDYRTGLVITLTMLMVFATILLCLGLFSGTPAGLAAALSPLSLIVPGAILARRLGWSVLCALPIPLMLPLFHYAMLHSTWKTLRQRGIWWRETFYSLEVLRAANVRG